MAYLKALFIIYIIINIYINRIKRGVPLFPYPLSSVSFFISELSSPRPPRGTGELFTSGQRVIFTWLAACSRVAAEGPITRIAAVLLRNKTHIWAGR